MPSKCVVVAESSRELLGAIRDLIRGMFDSVLMVGDEASMVDVLRKVKPQLLIVDFSLPVSKELNVARSIQKHFPSLDFIVVSHHDEAAAVTETLEAGASGFVLQRCVANDLIPCITQVLAGGRYVSPGAESDAQNANQPTIESDSNRD